MTSSIPEARSLSRRATRSPEENPLLGAVTAVTAGVSELLKSRVVNSEGSIEVMDEE